jgi:hypothetical protein
MRARSIVFAALSIPAALAASGARADVTISSAATQNMACSNGVCAPTASDAVLNVGDLENLLASANVEVTTTGAGVQANGIRIDTPLSWSSVNTLALNAYRGIAVAKPVNVTGAGGVTLTTNDGGSGGMLLFNERGHIKFANLTSPLTINGVSYTLANSIASLASAIKANPAGAYALAGDYDAHQDGTYGEPPIFTDFEGSFEGLGNTISHLKIRALGKRAAALFPDINPGASVAGLVLRNVNFYTDGGLYHATVSGGIAGVNWGAIVNCRVGGLLSGSTGFNGATGGLAGVNLGIISGSSANVEIITSAVAGGLVGDNSGTILDSSARGSIACGGSMGHCMFAGGLVGDNDGSQYNALISQNFATTTVTGYGARYGTALGGLIGNMDSGEDTTAVVTNSYATGSVSGDIVYQTNAGVGSGGLVGEFLSSPSKNLVEHSYATGAVSGQNGAVVGGFACQIFNNNAKLDYWDITTSGTDDGECGGSVSGVTGLTTTQLQSGLPTGFNPKVWKEDPNINNGLPYLINNPPAK